MNIIFLKGSFEDEGLRDFEVQILSSISKERNIPLAFKIGGCEAKSDIEKSINQLWSKVHSCSNDRK